MQKQRLTIPLSGGLATGTDGKQLPIGKSEELQNVRPGRLGEVTQRNGTSALPTALLGVGGSLPAPWALGTLRGDLVSFSGVGDHPANLYSPTGLAWATDLPGGASFAPSGVKTQRRGPIATSLDQISGNGLLPDSVDSGGVRFVIYSAVRSGVAMVVLTAIDIATGMIMVEVTRTGTYVSYGVRVVNGSAVFVYATTTLISIDTWPTASVASGPTPRVNVAKTVANAGRQFDMLVKDATTISGAYSDGTNVQCFDYVPNAAAAAFWTPLDSTAANIPTSYAIAWMQDLGASGKIALVARAAAGGLRAHWDIPTAGATRQAVTTYTLDASAASGTISGFTTSNSATGQFVVLYDDLATGTFSLIRAATREAGVIGTAVFYRSVYQESKPFIGPDNKFYIAAGFLSSTQPTRFVLRVPETRTNFAKLTAVVAKMQINNGYVGQVPQGPLCPVSNPASGEYTFSNTVQLRLPGNPTAYIPQGVGIDVVHVKFKALPDATTGAPCEAIDSLFTPGGTVGQFDGRSYCDAGFGYYPETAIMTPGGGAPGAMTSGATYFYAWVYRWNDANGRVWRSKPSAIQSQAIGANTSILIQPQTYRLQDRDDIAIEIYRGGANNSTTLQLVGSVVNDPTVDNVTFNDIYSDGTVASGEPLYTNGNAGNAPLGNDGIPGASAIAVTADRAWIVSNDNPYEVWPSNRFIPGQGWRFSEQNKLILNDNQGPVTAVAKQPSGVVVIFKANCYYLVSGDGPNQAGNGGSFTVSQPIVGAGTTNPRSILETPSGIEFRNSNATAGARSWYRVNTANATEYIGSPIERYSGSAIVGAVLLPTTGETRYVTSSGNTGDTRAIVHDTITDTWMIDTSPSNFGAQAAACAYGAGAAVAIGSTVYIDDPNSPGRDAGVAFGVLVTTPWIKGSDLYGYAMFREARGVGEISSILTTTVALQADFDATTNLALESAATSGNWDWAIKYPAKLSAFRFVVSFNAQALATPPKLSAIVAEYGVKPGFVPAAFTKRMQ